MYSSRVAVLDSSAAGSSRRRLTASVLGGHRTALKLGSGAFLAPHPHAVPGMRIRRFTGRRGGRPVRVSNFTRAPCPALLSLIRAEMYVNHATNTFKLPSTMLRLPSME